ncbi:hypothetical protein K469DRAFT_691814 [Zopfia rhizophila CBS 207.26]|uniref:Uncharacterized protein n=1 Tax=Zopfia rhizophila CBS 207.26 TaxID=1314779 RepID=A0A6A6DQ64_9PEZI|nr:hypothetical protein K469DRAFT_691814 [Zopfia rhizophila CBS 207.26]
MTSIKRLLNPSEDIDIYSFHRSSPNFGSLNEGETIDDVPVLQEQSWSGLLNEIFITDPDQIHASQLPNENEFNTTDFCFAQEGMELWAEQNLPSTSTTPEVNDAEEQLCYGMIYRAAVRLQGIMADLDEKLSLGDNCHAAGHYALKIVEQNDHIFVKFADGVVLGELNSQLAKALEKIIRRELVDFEVLAHIRTVRETIGKAGKAKDAIIRVNINVYGPRNIAKQVGGELSKSKIYLQKPDYQRKGVAYDNPHVLKLSTTHVARVDAMSHVAEPAKEKLTEADKEEQFKKIIGNVYTSLKRSHRLHGLEGDGRLKTPLLPHQKEALEFMTQRESGPIPEEFFLWKADDIEGQPCFRHVVTKQTCRLSPSELGGGILADEMGMGKSLSLLALVLKMLEKAHDWASRSDIHSSDVVVGAKRRSRATLIIASSALMINEWIQEIETHLHDQIRDALRVFKYHGQYRETAVAVLSDSDIVITTYHTLAADFANNRNPLNEIEWYRIVLDEAHIIRSQATSLNRTVSHLHAKFRWCLTGTPVQNRLEDIGTLFAFIKAQPFEKLSTFRSFIAAPFDEGGERRTLAIERFTYLLDSLVLRRTKELLHLPEKQDRIRKVEFSKEERAQYEQTKSMIIRAIRHQPGIFDRKSTLGMFQAQLQLRILCNHGTFQDPFSWKRRSLLEEREDAACALGSFSETTCSSCRQSMPIIDSNSVYRQWAEHCAHVLCSECLEESAQGSNEEIPSHCPLCRPIWAPSNSTGGGSTFIAKGGESDIYFRPEGYSSKMAALISDVQENLWETKSIVFSCWTRTLNLIQHYLQYACIPFERIDGECPLPRRQKILNNFAKNQSLRVLIMTTGTGAVGLNLTSANRVFIVEPQWNPSVENQAIARALRLGQGQSVLVTRYVIQGTVEQEMRSQQDRKLRIAGLV